MKQTAKVIILSSPRRYYLNHRNQIPRTVPVSHFGFGIFKVLYKPLAAAKHRALLEYRRLFVLKVLEWKLLSITGLLQPSHVRVKGTIQ